MSQICWLISDAEVFFAIKIWITAHTSHLVKSMIVALIIIALLTISLV